MTGEERARLLGDELSEAVDAYVAAPNAQTLSDFLAVLLGRATSMAAGAVVHLVDRMDMIEQRVTALEQVSEKEHGGRDG